MKQPTTSNAADRNAAAAGSSRLRLAARKRKTPTAAGATPRSASATSARPRSAGPRSACTTIPRTPVLLPRGSSGWPAAAGSLEPEALAAAITRRYGKDRTFSVPILTHCALCGRLGSGAEAWRLIPQLPFELAALPHAWFKWLRLPVVSYALPALIAIGQVRHRRRPTRNPLTRLAATARHAPHAAQFSQRSSPPAAVFWKPRR